MKTILPLLSVVALVVLLVTPTGSAQGPLGEATGSTVAGRYQLVVGEAPARSSQGGSGKEPVMLRMDTRTGEVSEGLLVYERDVTGTVQKRVVWTPVPSR